MKPPYIVAEVSASHLGDLPRALALIEAARDSGADAVKFQFWTPGTMALGEDVIPAGPWAGRKLADLYAEAQTPLEWIPELMGAWRRREIDVFASVFDHNALQELEKHDCPFYKIASFEILDLDLIDAVARTGKPLIISTGMANAQEILHAAARVDQTRLTLLHCSSAYPAPLNSLNLEATRTLERLYGVPVGFSDHTIGSQAAMLATVAGAVMIEKHITLDRADGGPDAGFASTPPEFKAMVQRIKEAVESMGTGILGCNQDELIHRDLRSTLHYAEDLSTGTLIQRSHLTTCRSGNGMYPVEIDRVLGHQLAHDVRRGDPVTRRSAGLAEIGGR